MLKNKIIKNNFEIENKEIGCNLTLLDYLHFMYPNGNEAGFIALAHKIPKYNKASEFVQRCHPLQELLENVNLMIDCYISMNTFYIPRRQKTDIKHLNALFVDIDFYNFPGLTEENVLEILDFNIKKELIPDPTFIINSGRGLYLIWKIEDVPGKYVRATKLYMAVQDYIYGLFKDVGADYNARDVSRILRLPASFNTKVNKEVKIIRHNPKGFYTLRFFQNYVNVFEEYPTVPRKKKQANKAKIKHLFNLYTLHLARIRDIETICSLRDYNVTGLRDQIVYIYFYYTLLIHQDKNIALNKTKILNEKFSEPLLDSEVRSFIVSSERTAKEKLEGKKPTNGFKDVGYNFKNETLIKIFKITEEEQKHLKTIISTTEKYDRKNKKRRKIGTRLEYLVKQKEQTEDKLWQLQQAINNHPDYSNRKLAHLLAISEGYIRKLKKKL